jgi:hypothetical protein
MTNPEERNNIETIVGVDVNAEPGPPPLKVGDKIKVCNCLTGETTDGWIIESIDVKNGNIHVYQSLTKESKSSGILTISIENAIESNRIKKI